MSLRENFANLFLALVVAEGLIDDILQSVSLALYMAYNSLIIETSDMEPV